MTPLELLHTWLRNTVDLVITSLFLWNNLPQETKAQMKEMVRPWDIHHNALTHAMLVATFLHRPSGAIYSDMEMVDSYSFTDYGQLAQELIELEDILETILYYNNPEQYMNHDVCCVRRAY